MKKKHAALLLTTLMMLAGCAETPDTGSLPKSDTTFVSDTATDSSTSSNHETISSNSEKPSDKDTALDNARTEALAYLDSIDTTLYRDEEKTELETTIATLKTAIASEDATVETIQAAIDSFRSYLASLKTKAEYEQEEEEKRNQELKEAREAKIAEATVKEINKYRSEERTEALALQNAEIEKINALTTKEEIVAYNLDDYQEKIVALKTNAEYTMDEMTTYHDYASKWDLVNEHAFTWEREGDYVKTQAVGYLYQSANTYDDVTFTMTVDANQDTN